MPKQILGLSYIQIGEDGSTLFKTDFFHVTVNRDNQVVPGILKITPTYEPLNNWDNWENNHWVELLQTIRLCELTLIKAFEPNRKHYLRPILDDKLINCYGKNRRINEKSIIYFDIVPRYKEQIQLRDLLSLEKSEVSEEELEPFKKDNLYGKPFNFDSPIKPSDKIYNSIVKKLLATINQNNFSTWLLEDSFGIKENCIACGNIIQHPHKTGIAEVTGFKIALDARSQEERGRAFCDTVMHIPALRYWEDEWIVDAGKIFSAYRATVNSLYKTENNREFDWMCLMNLAKEKEGPHTHIHFIPRTPNGKDYGRDFLMDISTYRSIEEAAITANTTKAAIVEEFRKKFNENLKKEEVMVIKSEYDEQQLLQIIDRFLTEIENYRDVSEESHWKKAIAYGFILNHVKSIKSTEQLIYRKKITKKLSEILNDIIKEDLKADYSMYAEKQQLFDKIDSFVGKLWDWRSQNFDKCFIEHLEKEIKNLFNYCFKALAYDEIMDTCVVLSLGSFSTGMATLYSDIEYFILVDNQIVGNEKQKNSFYHVSYLFNTVVNSLGENYILVECIHDMFATDDYNQIKECANKNKGLRIDNVKNPIKPTFFGSFIDTPENLVTSLLGRKETYHKQGNHATSALLTTKYFFGNLSLYNKYKDKFTDYVSKGKYLNLVIDFLTIDLSNNRTFSKKFDSDDNMIDIKEILVNMIHIIRGLYLVCKSCDGNLSIENNFFDILEYLQKQVNCAKEWIELIKEIYKLRTDLQLKGKSANATINIKDLKDKLHKENIKQILEEISDFVENKANNIITLHEAIKMSLEMPSNQPIARLSEFCSTSSSSISSYSGTPFSMNKDLDTIMLQLSQKTAEKDTLQFLPLHNKTAYNDLPENFRGFLSDNTQGERHLLANPHPSTEDFWNNMLNDDRKQILECKFRYPGA